MLAEVVEHVGDRLVVGARDPVCEVAGIRVGVDRHDPVATQRREGAAEGRLIVVLPTPPLRLITTIRREPVMGVRSRSSSSSATTLLRAPARG